MRAALAITALVSLTACSSVTEVVLEIDADPAVAARATEFSVTVQGGPPEWTDVTVDESIGVSLPRRITLAPLGGDVARRWRVEVTASEGADAFVTEVREGGYVEGSSITERIVLSLSGTDGGRPDGGEDAGVDSGRDSGEDSGASDSSPPTDSSRPDAGCDVGFVSSAPFDGETCNESVAIEPDERGAGLAADTQTSVDGRDSYGCILMTFDTAGALGAARIRTRTRAISVCGASGPTTVNANYHVFSWDGSEPTYVSTEEALPTWDFQVSGVFGPAQGLILCLARGSMAPGVEVEIDSVSFDICP